MSDAFPRYFRATIDFTVLDPEERRKLVLALKAAKGIQTNDETLAKRLDYEIGAGFVEIDGISDIEIH